MVDYTVLKIISKCAPNYHITAARRASSVCTCRACKMSEMKNVGGKTHLVCEPIYNALKKVGAAEGYSIVAENATCDAAMFTPCDMQGFKLEN